MALKHREHKLKLKKLGVDFQNEHLVFMRRDCHVCISEGFEALNRIRVTFGNKTLVASLIVLDDPARMRFDEIGLSKNAIEYLAAKEGDEISLSYLEPLDSMGDVRKKIYGHTLKLEHYERIIKDIACSNLSNIQLSAFLTACAGGRINKNEVIALTKSMIDVGFQLKWEQKEVYDKHCIGGLPGNRTTPIIVPIVAACGLTIPKTSSRAITSPAGTADAVETLTNVSLSMDEIKAVVKKENGCLAWGGSVQLSPADDIMIRVERALDLDSEGQLIASVLSKKKAAGSTHVVIDIPLGPTAKIRSKEEAQQLSENMISIGKEFGLEIAAIITDGRAPIGRGIGPSLEALDVLAVLENKVTAPQDLKNRSILLAGKLLEMGGKALEGEGEILAKEILESGQAFLKFKRICEAQGGLKIPKMAPYRQIIRSDKDGQIIGIDTRRISKVAKLAGAPDAPTAGVYLLSHLGLNVKKGQDLFEIFSESPGELSYAMKYLRFNPDIIKIES